MSLTAEQWAGIKQELGGACYLGRVELMIDGVKTVLTKEASGENKLVIAVYRDGFMALKGTHKSDKDFDEEAAKVHRKRTLSLYKPKEKAKLIKDFGKREAYRSFNLDAVSEWYEPWFPKIDPLIKQYKKLENIELISIGYRG